MRWARELGADEGAARGHAHAVDGVFGARLFVATGGLSERPSASQPSLAALPGARFGLDRSFGAEGLRVRAVCVVAPPSRWAPGLEDPVLELATYHATRALDVPLGALRAGPVTREAGADGAPARFSQSLASDAGEWTARGAHLLAFVGAPTKGLVCTLLCADRDGGARCAPMVGEATVVAPFVDAPPPSLVVRLVLAGASAPLHALGLVAALVVLLALRSVARRPRGLARFA